MVEIISRNDIQVREHLPGKDHPAVKGASEDDVKKLVKWVLSM